MVEEGSGNLNPAAMPSVQVANELLITISHVQSFQFLIDALLTGAGIQSMECRMVEQVLAHRKIKV